MNIANNKKAGSQNMTIRKIAEDLNLSTSTVSRALSDNYQISSATKKRVKKYAADINFTVNKFASGLRDGKTQTIGVVVCSIDSSFITQIINGIYDHCSDTGYQFLVMQSRGSFEREQNCVKMLVDNRVDGLLISPSFNSTDLTYLKNIQATGLPVVLFDRISDQIHTHKIAIDNSGGAFKVSEYLLDRNIKRTLVINCKEDVFLSRERLSGFLEAMKYRGLEQREELIAHCDPSNPEVLQAELTKLFTENFVNHQHAEAIFTTTDSFTTTAIKVLNKLGLEVPLAGFCNSDLADIFSGHPTTIYQPAYELGTLAAKQLLSLIKNKEEDFETLYLPTKLIVRS
ncbi:LacI family DNA-binding transcriptional regulator [Pedobacter nutrimenti]|uniref:LacI family DNA-binding transcriptional regulator n=1 Tax=Pedobacter nutrimenti TaxID=1241337 RepID=UPI00292E37BB|nr:LacI family DNA-binding transcriptional regulator [Pedobacter nutrimenti]